jgi:hypothetical protein
MGSESQKRTKATARGIGTSMERSAKLCNLNLSTGTEYSVECDHQTLKESASRNVQLRDVSDILVHHADYFKYFRFQPCEPYKVVASVAWMHPPRTGGPSASIKWHLVVVLPVT